MSEQTYTYRTIYEIPQYLVQEIGDAGLVETIVKDGEKFLHHEKDDLCVAIMLSGGVEVLLTGKQRMVFEKDSIIIQDLFEE